MGQEETTQVSCVRSSHVLGLNASHNTLDICLYISPRIRTNTACVSTLKTRLCDDPDIGNIAACSAAFLAEISVSSP